MHELILNLIIIIHIIFIIFIITTPFIDNKYLLLIYIIIVPFIILHWILNNDICILTTIEKHIRKQIYGYVSNDCFTCNLINPIYNFINDNKTYSDCIYIITISLWLISIYNFFYKKGGIQFINTLFIKN